MKKYIFPLVVALTFISFSSSAQLIPGIPDGTKKERVKKSKRVIISPDGTRIRERKNLPPGQEKKIYGDKSAKAYAPGQRKKANGNIVLRDGTARKWKQKNK